MRRIRAVLCAAVVTSLATADAEARSARRAVPTVAAPKPKRELVRRTLALTDAREVPRVHVAGGLPTTLSFAADVDAARLLLADALGRFFAPQVSGRTLVLVPKVDLGADDEVVLQVALLDGTLVPLRLVSLPTAVDLTVDVVAAPASLHAAPASAAALARSVAELRGRLDECEASAGELGLQKVAQLVLAQDPSKPEAFVVERRAARALDKQSRLLVEVKQLYRLFGVGYLVLTVENRDPSQVWVMERAEVAVGSGDVRVVAVASEQRGLVPGGEQRLVVAFRLEQQEGGEGLVLKLFERGGSRHVELPF